LEARGRILVILFIFIGKQQWDYHGCEDEIQGGYAALLKWIFILIIQLIKYQRSDYRYEVEDFNP
jgi:hypothetical protein